MDKKSVCVAMVTYNRKDLLKNLLIALSDLDYSPDGIVIVDNLSVDGTDKMLCEMGVVSCAATGELEQHIWKNTQIYYYRNTYNAGGSGGFAKALDIAKDLPFDYIWIMDDDVMPQRDCLKVLLRYIDDTAGVAVPSRGDENYMDYAVQHFDLEKIRYFRGNDCKRDMIRFSDMKEEFVYIEDMTFEGPLLKRNLIHKIGIPNEEYFILYDDTDYAHRLNEVTKIRYVRDARLHRVLAGKGKKQPFRRYWSWKDYYNFRNAVYFDRTYGKNLGVRYIRSFLRLLDLLVRAVGKGNFYRIRWLFRAYFEAMSGRMGKTCEISEIPTGEKRKKI